MKLTIEATPKADMAYTNHVYVHPTDRALLSPTPGPLKVSLLDKVWDCSASEEVLKGSITLSFLQRGHACAMLDCRADVAAFDASDVCVPSSMGFRVTKLGPGRNGSTVVEAKVETLLAEVKRVFDHQVLEEGQKLALKHDEKIALQLEVFGMGFPAREEDPVDAHEGHFESYRGRFEGDRTEILFVSSNRVRLV